ncbi:MAG TPA: hypothetical protein VFT87_05390 [Candidatus Saccharimonadales bacterium]|nr:hypothetical protein [Candidatus Saccharimonadales bacterium]
MTKVVTDTEFPNTRGSRRLQKRAARCANARLARLPYEEVPAHLRLQQLEDLYGTTVTVEMSSTGKMTHRRDRNDGSDKTVPVWESPRPIKYTGTLCPANSAERRRDIAAILEVSVNGTTIRVNVTERALTTLC